MKEKEKEEYGEKGEEAVDSTNKKKVLILVKILPQLTFLSCVDTAFALFFSFKLLAPATLKTFFACLLLCLCFPICYPVIT